MPPWASTLIYLAMGWGVVFCYRELARLLGHRTLLPLPVGGAFYSVGAIINLAGWPVLFPGILGAHDLFHFFVIAGSACHVLFMLRTVVPAEQPAGWLDPVLDSGAMRVPQLAPAQPLPPSRFSRWGFRLLPQPGGSPFPHPHVVPAAETPADPGQAAATAAVIPREHA